MTAMPKIVTVASPKGGVGKTTIAYELAYLLDAPLVDLDWDQGNSTRQWGYRHEDRMKAPLLDGLERGKAPAPLRGERKPDLVPCHPDFATNQPEAEDMAGALSKWAVEWDRPYVVVDTHPGFTGSSLGAMQAASCIVTPGVFKTKELEALDGMLTDMPDYPILIVPNMVPPIPPAPELKRLREMVGRAKVQVGPPIHRYEWIGRRKIRVALTSYDPEPNRIQVVADELRAVAGAVKSYGS
jgi:chromosome partitioning protein